MPGTFVSIGNGTQSFRRLLDAVRAIAPSLPQPVVVQHGRTPFAREPGIESFDFTDEAGFRSRLAACDLFITHGGGGSVFTAIRMGKKPVVAPRRQAEDEIVDDHQMYMAEELARLGKIEPVYDMADLLSAATRVLAAPGVENDFGAIEQSVDIVRESLERHAPDASDSVLLVTPSGGHLTEMRNLAPCYSGHPHHFVINVPIADDPQMQGRTTLLTLSQRDWKFIINIWEAWQILRRERPAVILTTGGSMSVPFVILGRLMGIPTVYVETIAKVIVPTLTGRLIYPFANDFFYQWPQLRKFFPRGRFIGFIV